MRNAQENALQTGDIDEFLSFVSKNDGAFFMRFGYDVDGSDGKVARVEASDYLAAYCYYRDEIAPAAFFHYIQTAFKFIRRISVKFVETDIRRVGRRKAKGRTRDTGLP